MWNRPWHDITSPNRAVKNIKAIKSKLLKNLSTPEELSGPNQKALQILEMIFGITEQPNPILVSEWLSKRGKTIFGTALLYK